MTFKKLLIKSMIKWSLKLTETRRVIDLNDLSNSIKISLKIEITSLTQGTQWHKSLKSIKRIKLF